MKKKIFLCLQLLSSNFLYAQNGSVDTTPYNPHDLFVTGDVG